MEFVRPIRLNDLFAYGGSPAVLGNAPASVNARRKKQRVDIVNIWRPVTEEEEHSPETFAVTLTAHPVVCRGRNCPVLVSPMEASPANAQAFLSREIGAVETVSCYRCPQTLTR
eukprot:1195541-Prorocentrum_minimum.AAC.6